MKRLLLLPIAVCLLSSMAHGAEPRYRVTNNSPPAYTVVNKTAPAADAPDTLRTASGRLIRLTPSGYVYADEATPAPGVAAPGPFVPSGAPSPATPPTTAPRVGLPNTSFPGSTATGRTATPARGVLRLGITNSGPNCVSG